MVDRYDQEMFLEYVEGELPTEKRIEFEQLMLQDPRLRNLVAQLVIDRHRLRTLPDEDPPAQLAEQADQRLERLMLIGAKPEEYGSGRSPAQSLKIRRMVTHVGLAAGFAVVAGVIVIMLADLMNLKPRSWTGTIATTHPPRLPPPTPEPFPFLNVPPFHLPQSPTMLERLDPSLGMEPPSRVEPLPDAELARFTLRITTANPVQTSQTLKQWAGEHQVTLPEQTSLSEPITIITGRYALAVLLSDLNAQENQTAKLLASTEAEPPTAVNHGLPQPADPVEQLFDLAFPRNGEDSQPVKVTVQVTLGS